MDVKVFGQNGGWGVEYIHYLRMDVTLPTITFISMLMIVLCWLFR